MALTAESIPGVSVDVAELINVRSRLSGLSLKQFRHRTSKAAGVRETRIRGRGMEYEESRAYMPGDDVRTMDWRVMARTGVPYTKVFTEEKQRTVMLVIDLSPSMFFGTRHGFKSWAAARLAAHLGWLVVGAGDRLGGLIASAAGHHEVRPQTGSTGLMRLFHHLADECNHMGEIGNNGSCLNFMLAELRRVIKPGSIIVLISDFLGIDESTPSLLSPLVRHNDLMAFWVFDQSETRSWPRGQYQLLTNNNPVSLDLAGGTGPQWLHDQQKEHRLAIENLVAQFKIWQYPVSCNQDITAQLSSI